jgi:dimethylargininase
VTSPAAQPTLARKLIGTVLAAGATGVAAHVATMFLVLAGYQFSAGIPEINGIFIASTLFLFIALVVFGFIGIYTRWYFALLAGIVLSIGSALGGATVAVASSGAGTSLTIDQLLGTLVGINAPFVVFGTLATVFLAPLVYRAVLAPRRAVAGERRIALVRVPAENLADGLVTHIERSSIDGEKAEEQWDAYVTALLDNGWSTIEVEPAPTLADSVFIEDAVVVFGSLAVVTLPGAESRVDELDGAEQAVAELGLDVRRIAAPGTLDGGDVLKVGSTVYVGRGGRTNAEGVRQLRAILDGTGYSVVAVPVTKVLHLKSAVTALPDGTVIGHPSLVDDVAVFDRFLAVPEESGSHVVVLAADTVLMAASAPKSAALIADLGYRVVTVDISEFEKLEGCVTCLSVRIR